MNAPATPEVLQHLGETLDALGWRNRCPVTSEPGDSHVGWSVEVGLSLKLWIYLEKDGAWGVEYYGCDGRLASMSHSDPMVALREGRLLALRAVEELRESLSAVGTSDEVFTSDEVQPT